VFVSYRLNGADQQMALHEFDDWVDPKIIVQLNRVTRLFSVFPLGATR